VDFKISCVYNYVTKLCKKKVEVIENYLNPNVVTIRQGEVMHRKYERLRLGCGLAYCPTGHLLPLRICFWTSPAQTFVFSDSVGTNDHVLLVPIPLMCFQKWSLFFDERKGG
jgi:hypothetical protein